LARFVSCFWKDIEVFVEVIMNVEKVRKWAEKGNVKGLIKALYYKKDGSVIEAAVIALGKMKDPRAVEALKNFEDMQTLCSVCGISLATLSANEAAFMKNMQDMGVGLMLGSPVAVMLKCPVCGLYTCSKCALDGAEMKRCPQCKALYNFNSIVS
jgi:uncharacterized membrane protein (DUF441 family)